MPQGTPVARCVKELMRKGHSKESAIKICQKSTGLSYMTGRRPKKKKWSDKL